MYIKQFAKITLTFDFQRLIQMLVLKIKIKNYEKKSAFENYQHTDIDSSM